jgi:hypothetical protein
MPRTKHYKKHIACLESLWDEKVENRLSIRPLLELMSSVQDIRYIYLSSNTLSEFEFNLASIRSRRNYQILYLGFHGTPGSLHLPDQSEITLEKLAKIMGKRFNNWIIHFGSCSTLNIEGSYLHQFIDATDTSILLGYIKDIDWIDSAAMDLILFDWLQEYKDMASFWNRIIRSYQSLVEMNGLRIFPFN